MLQASEDRGRKNSESYYGIFMKLFQRLFSNETEVIVINGIPKIREILSHERCHHLTANVPKDKVKDTSCV